jgi:hypothetical protein
MSCRMLEPHAPRASSPVESYKLAVIKTFSFLMFPRPDCSDCKT